MNQISTNVCSYEVRYFENDYDMKNNGILKIAYISAEQAQKMGAERSSRVLVSIPGVGAFAAELIRGIFPIDRNQLEKMKKHRIVTEYEDIEVEGNREYQTRITKKVNRETNEIEEETRERLLIAEYTEKEIERRKSLAKMMKEKVNSGLTITQIMEKINEEFPL